MTIKVGINGFGRIGRFVFRASFERADLGIEVVGINDLIDVEYMAYMLKYDSTHGRFKGTVEVKDGNLVVNGKTVRVTAERDPANLKWDAIGVDVVAEGTGLFLDDATARKHITAGAKKVVMTGPSKDATPMFVMGVNHTEYAGQDIVSNASCTTNCLAPIAKVLNDTVERDGPTYRASRTHHPAPAWLMDEPLVVDTSLQGKKFNRPKYEMKAHMEAVRMMCKALLREFSGAAFK